MNYNADRERTKTLFEYETELEVIKMSKIGPNLWMIEASDGNTYTVRTYEGPMSVD